VNQALTNLIEYKTITCSSTHSVVHKRIIVCDGKNIMISAVIGAAGVERRKSICYYITGHGLGDMYFMYVILFIQY